MYLNKNKGLIIFFSQEEYNKYINSWEKKLALELLKSKYEYKVIIKGEKKRKLEEAKKMLGLL